MSLFGEGQSRKSAQSVGQDGPVHAAAPTITAEEANWEELFEVGAVDMKKERYYK